MGPIAGARTIEALARGMGEWRGGTSKVFNSPGDRERLVRIMRPHVTSEGTVDYYECSDCGWAHPFPRFLKDSEIGIPNEKIALQAFTNHVCKQFPRRPKS